VKKVLCLLLATALALSLWGCAGQPASSAPPAAASTEGGASTGGETSSGATAEPAGDQWDYELDTSPYELTVWWPSVWPWAAPSMENDWGSTGVTKSIQELTGITLNVDVPIGEESEIAGPVIASGAYPDMMIFGGYNNVFATQMEAAGNLYAISDLMDEYAPRMYELITPTLMQLQASADGKLWKYVGFEYDLESVDAALEIGLTPSAGGNIMFVRNDVLKAYGKEDISTLGEVAELLVFIRENFPDLDPLRMHRNMIDNNHFKGLFGLHLSGTYPQGDKLELVYKDPLYFEFVSWFNDLYRKGVISNNMMADSEQIRDEKTLAGKYGMVIDATFNIYNTINTTIETNTGSTETTYKAVGPAPREGVEFKASSLRGKGNYSAVITKNAVKPDRAIRFLEFLLTDEGQTLITLGVEGESWKWDGGRRVLLPEPAEEIATDLQAYATKYDVLGRWAPFAKTTYWYRYCDDFLTPVGPLRDENNGRLDPYVHDYWADGFIDIVSSLEIGSPEEIAKTRITDVHETAFAKMVAAKSDEELKSLYDSFMAEIESLGAAKVEAAYTQMYQDNLARINEP
jgi:putative aldouronate transport system substrate-binding protein